MILAIDPGYSKCGLAALDTDKTLKEKKIVKTAELAQELKIFLKDYPIDLFVLGSATYSKKLRPEIEKLGIKLILADESFSTLDARKRYWKDHPPRGLWKLIPTSLRLPPRPIDDYAAVILGEKYLNR